MDWSNESYVRIYKRDTRTWLRLRWEGQCLFVLLCRKVDRAGILDNIIEPVEDLSLITGFPEEHTAVGLRRLIKLGVVEINDNATLVIPNFMTAQEATKTDRLRQKESREKRKLAARNVTKRDANVTKRDETVTSGHKLSQGVTQCCAIPIPVLCSTDPSNNLTASNNIKRGATGVKPVKKSNKRSGVGTPTWEAYKAAYSKRYGVEPQRSAKTNSQCVQLVKCLGAEQAPQVAAYYLQSPNEFYPKRYHALGLLVKDAESIRAEMLITQKARPEYREIKSYRPDLAQAKEQ